MATPPTTAPQHPQAPATRIIATVDRWGRVIAIQGNNEYGLSLGLEYCTWHEFPLGTKIQPGQMVNTVVVA